MYRISCIIVEDEPLAAKVLQDYIAQIPFLDLRGSFKDAIDATEYLRTNSIDLIFLDIHLPKLKGMAFIKTLTHPPAIIITTAYHQYAVEGFDLNVTDYLLKPFEFERFLVAVTKVKSAQKPVDDDSKGQEKDHLFITEQKKKVKILFVEILYVESQREYVRIVTTKKEHLTRLSTHEIEALLPSEQFRRIHRSFIVSLDKIESYSADEVEVNGIAIPVGRDYRHVLDEFR
jgi:two-component system LytT family response regulator